ncbi:hypothetical protein POM88_018693 [Heracleum sosnowskyi]|uniref:Uncharacterized protein n=1 Tax=Heracleum sosnowskyi TaxID=360622 RepID=A0AAD8IRJ6_9APIA|nr:hypothetical protein POM88_018693 [Heracleum sosnowskyi]
MDMDRLMKKKEKKTRYKTNNVQALAAISDFLSHLLSPFYNLKYVKVPKGYDESPISTSLKFYLLGRSPKATIVTTLPGIPQMLSVILIPQNLLPEKPLATLEII